MQGEPSFFTQDILFTSPRNERCKRVLTEKTRGGQAKECKLYGERNSGRYPGHYMSRYTLPKQTTSGLCMLSGQLFMTLFTLAGGSVGWFNIVPRMFLMSL